MRALSAILHAAAAAALLGPSLAGAAAPAPFEARHVTLTGQRPDGQPVDDVKMPWFSGADARAAARINDWLWLTRAASLAPRAPVASVRVADTSALDASADFTVDRADARVLALTISAESCGAYCEPYDQAERFDARTGRHVTPDELFTPEGRAALARRLRAETHRRYAQALKDNRDALAEEKRKPTPDAQTLEDLQQRIELDQRCQGDDGAKPPADKALAAFGYLQVGLVPGRVRLVAGRCGSHAEGGLDDVGNVGLEIDHAALRPQLTPYGRALLLGEDAAPGATPGNAIGQVLHGTLGRTAVTMLLSSDDGRHVSGGYAYDRHGQRIVLEGILAGNRLALTERSGGRDPVDVARLALSVAGDRLKGRWIGKDGKTFDVDVGF